MRIRTLFSLAILAITVLLAAGCTGSSGPSGASTTVPTTSAPAVSAPVTTPAMTNPETTVTASYTRLITTTATPAPDPILHRWVREYPTFTTDMPWAAYDFVFLSGGSVTYTFGVPIKSGSNIRIVSQQKMSGTWEKIGNNTYRVVIPATSTSSQIYRVYTRVPATVEAKTGVVTVNEHLESSYETGSLPTGRDKQANEMYYPERADS
ncbi:hypothetical protein [Methanoregula sp. UBA64]|jgi:hypothetical protein|uniref:hypothetical protein n=1 Tax=Methanoregula sp. UBA64 TaxID=1915554 RepID=UPI0025CCEF15|nr:hypothetical protein [Methanoregula sp. UBA64]